MNGYCNIGIQMFEAKAAKKATYKIEKIQSLILDVESAVKTFQTSLDDFKSAFDDMNGYVSSDNWTDTAKAIAEITDEIRGTIGTSVGNLAKDVQDVNDAVTATDAETAVNLSNNSKALSTVGTDMQKFATPKYRNK